MSASTAQHAMSRGAWLTVALFAALAGPHEARAEGGAVHTRLESSMPEAGSILRAPPERFELRFTGPVDSRLSAIVVLLPEGDSISLAVLPDPNDDRLLVASAPALPAGKMTLRWQTVSADGHPVEGEFTFTVEAESVPAAPGVPGVAVPPTAPEGLQAVETGGGAHAVDEAPPPTTALLAGIGLACLLGFAGLLWYAGAGPLHAEPHLRLAVTLLGWAAVLLLAADLAAWLGRVRLPDSGFSGLWRALTTQTGLVASGQLLLAASAAALADRSGRLAGVLALIAVLTGAANGHPAAISPEIAISANAIHLGAAAIWTGGLLLLVLIPDRPTDGSEHWKLQTVASSVSAAALLAVLLIVGSGIVQSVLFIGRFDLLADSTYGRTVLMKTAGLLVLAGFGAYHRKRTLPALEGIDGDDPGSGGASLRATMRLETVVMLVVILVAAYLARTSPPAAP